MVRFQLSFLLSFVVGNFVSHQFDVGGTYELLSAVHEDVETHFAVLGVGDSEIRRVGVFPIRDFTVVPHLPDHVVRVGMEWGTLNLGIAPCVLAGEPWRVTSQ